MVSIALLLNRAAHLHLKSNIQNTLDLKNFHKTQSKFWTVLTRYHMFNEVNESVNENSCPSTNQMPDRHMIEKQAVTGFKCMLSFSAILAVFW